MNSKQLLRRVCSLLAISAAATGCGDSAPGDGKDPVDDAFAMLPTPASPPLGLHIVPNCRLADTRGSTGTFGGPALVGGGPSGEAAGTPTRDFPVATLCGVPASAKAIAAHIASLGAPQLGYISIGPADGPSAPLPTPLTATLNYQATAVAADATTLAVGDHGIRVFSIENSQFIIDITGYYTELPQPPIRVTPVGGFVANVQQTSSPDWNAWNNLGAGCGSTDTPTSYTNGEQHTPPLGTGSFDADLTIPANAASGAALAADSFNGLKVGDITGLRYSTRQDTLDTPYLYINIDSTGGNTYDETIYFIPANNQAAQGNVVSGGVWQTWDAGTGGWNDSSNAAPVVHYNQDFTGASGTMAGDWQPFAPSPGTVLLNGDGTANVFGTAYTQWGGYSSIFPTFGYTTSLDVFIDVTATGQWDFSSAINDNTGTNRRDFAFSVGQDTILGDPAQWFVSTANNSPGDPANGSTLPAHAVITTTGWYTFEENFHDNGSGVLAVTLTVKPAAVPRGLGGPDIQSWTLSTPADTIATTGGNRYGWFTGRTVTNLKVDNEVLTFNGGPGPDTGPLGTHPLSNYSNATILGIRAAMGCSTGAASGHEAVDDFEIAFGGNPATIYDFEHH